MSWVQSSGPAWALTPDEFALWLYMDDVYWTEAGRRSMDAVFVALVLTGPLLLGFAPVKRSDPFSRTAIR